MVKDIERIIKPNPKKKKPREVYGWLIVEKNGTVRKAKDYNGLREIEPIEGGCSYGDGIPTRPILDGRLRKRAKRNKK